MKLDDKWHDWLRATLQMLVATCCVVVVLLISASDISDGDEFKKGIPAGIIGTFGGWIAGRMFGRQ